jgi:hypothetical protein
VHCPASHPPVVLLVALLICCIATFCITVFKTHLILWKKMGLVFKTMRGYKHVNL